MAKWNSSSFSLHLLLLLSISVNLVCSSIESSEESASSAVHIVYTEKPPENEEAESYHLRTLTSVLGSEEAAKEALVYSYKSAASGFSAKLTPAQVEEISKQPGVLQVLPSTTLQLHTGGSVGLH